MQRQEAGGVLLSHPGTGQFVQQVARALHEGGLLTRFATTVVDRPDTAARRALRRVPRIGRRLDRAMRARRLDALIEPYAVSHPALEFARVAASRLDPTRVAADLLWSQAEREFDRWVASTQLHDVDAVYGYEHAAYHTFVTAERMGIKRILDLPAPEQEHVWRILRREYSRFPDLATSYLARKERTRGAVRERIGAQLALANLALANSRLTRASFESAGHDVSRVVVLPLGAPPVVKPPRAEEINRGTLRFVWAGSMDLRKGAHYLLDAWRARGRLNGRLLCYGQQQLPESQMNDLGDDFELMGQVPHHDLMTAFSQADALVFPTLCDGFGLVITEALARGLPVITTREAGASDLIEHEKNGYLVPAGDSAALVEAMHWFDDNREVLPELRAAAMRTAADNQWSDYRERLRTLVRPLLGAD